MLYFSLFFKKKSPAFKPFTFYTSLGVVLRLYGMSGYRPQEIPQFIPDHINIDHQSLSIQHCIADLQLKLRTIGSVTSRNEVS